MYNKYISSRGGNQKTSKTTESVSQSRKYAENISLGEKIAYGGGDLASNLILVLTSTFVTFFYTDALGLNAAIIGTIMMLSRVFDGLSDIFMGFVMDQVKSKHGKARCWMLWLAIPIAIATVLVFLVPNIGKIGKYIYVIITYNLVITFLYTMINIPYGALTSLMTRDQNQRTVINIFRMFMAQVGSLIINAFTLPFINAVGGSTNQRSWIIVSVIYGIVAAALFLTCFAKTKERVQISSQQKERIPLGESFRLCMKNNYWLIIVAIWVVMALGMGMGMSVGTYYAKYILGNENLSGFLSAVALIPVLICMPLVAPLSKKYGKRNVALVGSIISVVAQSAMLINPHSFGWLIACNVMKGVGQAALTGTLFAMVADTIEYGQWKTGKRVEGMLYSSTTFGAKIGAGVGMAIAMGILGAAGYVGTAAVQTETALSAIQNLYLLAPLPFMIAMPILYYFYKLDQIYPQVMAELEQREKEGKM